MSRLRIEESVYTYPMAMVVVGTLVEERPNFMAVGWVTRVNARPPMIAVALGKAHYTNLGIHASGAFSVNVPGTTLLEKVDYVGLVSGRREDKSDLFTVIRGEKTGTPLIEECPLSMECRLVHTVDLPTNELFVGEIVGAWAHTECMTDGRPDIEKIRPFTLTMPDNRYWSVGEVVGKAWGSGRGLKRG